MMIMKVRDFIKGRGGQVILIMLLLSMVGGWGIGRTMLRLFGGSWERVVVINGYDVPRSDFQRLIMQHDAIVRNMREQYGNIADMVLKMYGMDDDPVRWALKTIVNQTLLGQQADAMQLELSDIYIKSHAGEHYEARSAVDQKNIEQELRNQFLLELLTGAVYVPETVLHEKFDQKFVAKQFSVQTFLLSHFLREAQAAGATDEQLKNFYNEQNLQSKRYWVAEKRSGTKWIFSAKHYGITVSEKEIEEYYQKNKASKLYIESPAQFKVREIIFNQRKEKGVAVLKEQAESVRERVLKDPDSFAAVAQEVSQGETAKKGGLVDFFTRGTKEKAYEQAVIRLKENGDISSVIELKDGFALVQRVDRKEAVHKSLSAVRHDIENALREQKFKRKFAQEAQEYISANSEIFTRFISEHQGKQESIELLERAASGDAQRLFSVKRIGDKTCFIQENAGVIVQLDVKEEKYLPDFEKIKSHVKHDFFNYKAEKALHRTVKKAALEASKTGTCPELPGATITTTEFIHPDNREKITGLINTQGYPADFMSLTRVGSVLSHIHQNKAVLLVLTKNNEAQESTYKQKRKELLKSAYNEYKSLITGAYIASLHRTGTIEVDEQFRQGKESSL